jgi:hypothetical protein
MNRVEQVTKKYPDHIDAALSIEDPSSSHKYLLWTAKQLHAGASAEDVGPTVNYLGD